VNYFKINGNEPGTRRACFGAYPHPAIHTDRSSQRGHVVALTLPIGLRPTAFRHRSAKLLRAITSPRDIEYVSELRTGEARLARKVLCSGLYKSGFFHWTPADRHLNTTLQLITSVRDDELLEYEKKKSQIADLSDVRLQPDMVEFLSTHQPRVGMPSSRIGARA